MRYRYIDPSGMHTLTVEEILKEYFEYWSNQMRKAGKENLITPERCIEDWVVIHWAYPVEQ